MALAQACVRARTLLLSASFATLLTLSPKAFAQSGRSGYPVGSTPGFTPSGVSSVHLPITAAQIAATPGLTLAAPPLHSAAGPTRGSAAATSGSSSVTGANYQGCTAAADTPPQEIVDLAASLKNNWQLIYAYVYNTIDTEPSGESTKGALGTYLDGSGNSFDQSTLLVLLLRAAGYPANFVVGTTTFTASQLGLVSLPQQLIKDAGGSSNGTTPYAWVEINVNGAWVTLDPASKAYTLLPGTNLTQWLVNAPPPQNRYTPGVLDGMLNSIGAAYNSTPSPNYESLKQFIGGRQITYMAAPPTNARSGGAIYFNLPTSLRTGYSLQSANSSAIYFCTDETYGHILSYAGGTFQVDGLTAQSGLSDPINITIWHPNPGGSAWGQAAAENLQNFSAVFSFGEGSVGRGRAQHDGNIVNALASSDISTAGTNAALIATASGELSQTAKVMGMLDQLAGTYTVNHHMLQIVRSNNTIDTPLTSTSVDQLTSTPASGLTVSPTAVTYALSAAQSAQEAVALGQAGASQPTSAAALLAATYDTSGVQDASGVVFVKSTAGPPANYSASQQSLLASFQQAGYDLVVPTTAPSASSPLGFVAMNGAGASQFVLSTSSGVYKGAADMNPASGLTAASIGGAAAESNPAMGLQVNAGSGEVTYAAPLISVGSTAPYKLEFDLLYSSRPDAQVTASVQTPAGRPDSPGFAHNLEIRATTSSDGFPMVGSDLAGPAMPGISAAWNLLVNSNVIAQYYGGSSVPSYSPLANVYANAVIGNWLISAGTNNVVTVTSGLSSKPFFKLPWAGYVTAQPSGDQLTAISGGGYTLVTAQNMVMVFNGTDGQISSSTTRSGVKTSFSYSAASSGQGSNTAQVNLLSQVSVGPHSLSFGYVTPSTGTNLLFSVKDETGRTALLEPGNCNGSVQPATAVGQICAGLKPGVSSQPWPTILNFTQPQAGLAGKAVLLAGIQELNTAVNGYNATVIAYDGARMMPTSLTNANNHKTSYYIAPNRSEVDDALGNDSYSVTHPLEYFGEYVVTDSFDPIGNRTELSYNDAGQLVSKTLPDTPYCAGCNYSYTYDTHGNLASTAIGPTSNNQQITTSTVWNQTWNKPYQVTDGQGNTTTYSYDGFGQLTNVAAPSVLYYGSSSQPSTMFAYYSNGQLQSATTPDGEVTFYTYDSNYNLQTIVTDHGAGQHLNLTTTLGYDSANVGNLTAVTSARGYKTTMTYDAARRVLTKTTPPVAADGNVAHTTTYTYDTVGRLLRTSQDATSASPYAELVSQVTYDPADNVASRTMPTTGSTNHTITYTYDADERLSTTTTPVSSSANDVTKQGYDNDSRPFQTFRNGILTQTTIYNGDSLPAQVGDGAAVLTASGQLTGSAHITTYYYDLYDRLTKTTYADGSSEQLTLDHDGQVTTDLGRNGLTTAYTYDAGGRVTQETDQSFSTPFTMTYNLVGQLLTKTYSAGTFTYFFDTAGRQIKTTRPDGLAIGYSYDADGNTATITYPDQYLYTYGYDELDRMANVQELAPTSGAATQTLATYTWSPLAQRSTDKYGNGTGTTYGYDAFEGLTSIAHSFNTASSPPSASYAYTLDYEERRQTDSVNPAALLWHPPAAATTTYQPNALNQYASINGQALGYDSNGNLTGDPTAPLGSATYQFDQKNQLTSASNTQHSATYTYDPFSRRASKTVDQGSTTVFVDDGSRTLADYNGSGSEIQHYVYGAGSTPFLVEVFNGAAKWTNLSYIYTDRLGSTGLLAGQGGNVSATFGYSPFGEAGTTLTSAYGFAGMRLDAETQLYYDNARYYSPAQGRFLSADPIGLEGGVNIYAYTANDPLNSVDLTGNWYVPGRLASSSAGAGSATIDGFLGTDSAGVGGDISSPPVFSYVYTLLGSDPLAPSSTFDLSSSSISSDPASNTPPAAGLEGQPAFTGVSTGSSDSGGGFLGSDDQHPIQPGVTSISGPDSLLNPSTNIVVSAPRPSPSIDYSTEEAALGFALGPVAVALVPEDIEVFLADESGAVFLRGKAGNIAGKINGTDTLDMTVAQAIKSRGGTAGVVGKVATNLQQSIVSDVIKAAASGDEAAASAVKLIKSALRLGQHY